MSCRVHHTGLSKRLTCACEPPGLSQLVGVLATIRRLIFVVPEANFDAMTEQQLVTSDKKQMQADRIHKCVRDVKQFVLAVPLVSGVERMSAKQPHDA